MPQADETFGDLAALLAADYGLTPDPWQANVLDDWLLRRNGRWAALRCGLAVPRQNGKNGVLEMREIFGMIGRGEHILHTAHLVKTAAKHFRRLKEFFGSKTADPTAKYPELNAMVREIRNVNGQEAIYLKDVCVRCGATRDLCECPAHIRELRQGGSLEIMSRSRGSGRGYTVDVIVFDEAQELDDDELEALMPTTSSAPLGDPQWIFTGTPPGPEAEGTVWTRIWADAHENQPTDLAWDEWAVKEVGNVRDQTRWYRTNPALGRRLQLAVLQGEVASMSEEGFARERLGRWSESRATSPISAELWGELVNGAPPIATARPDALAVDMSHDRVIAIAGCWVQDDDIVHVELLALDQSADPFGAIDWITRRAGKRIPVVIDDKSPAASLAPTLKRNRVNVIVTYAPDMGKACEMTLNDIKFHRLRHAGQAQLDEAVAGLRKRPLGDAGLFGWDRKDPDVNIAPAVAITLARYGATKSKRRTANARGGRSSNGREAVLLSA